MPATNHPAAALRLCIDAMTPPRSVEEQDAVAAAHKALSGFVYPADSLETAACIWEAVLDMASETTGDVRSPNPVREARAVAIRAVREAIGTSALRLAALGWVDVVDAAWREADRDGYGEPFDWGFVPDWIIRNVDWSGPNAPTVRAPSPLNDLDPELRAWLVDDLGGTLAQTGGGCIAVQVDGANGAHVWLTGTDGGSLPTATDWIVGAYAGNDEHTELLSLASDGCVTMQGAVRSALAAANAYNPPAPSLAFDISFDVPVRAVVRGVATREEAETVARSLAERIEATNETLRGADYLVPLVTEFSIHGLSREDAIGIDALED